MEIGFIGLGQMGVAVAENLLRAGHRLTVWNRSPGAAQALATKGATAAHEPRQALQGDILISMLASDEAMRAVGLDGALLDGAAKGLLHINLATISVALARELAAAHASRSLDYVAAPVFGRPDVAAQAQLVLVAAGKPEALERAAPIFSAIGRRTVIAGNAPEQANLFKIAGNFLIASTMETIGEAFALLRKGGVDHALFHEMMTEKLFSGVVYRNYGALILKGAFEPAGFALRLGLKDVNLAREAAQGLDVPMPLGEIMREHYEAAVEQGLGDKDWSAVSALIARRAGL